MSDEPRADSPERVVEQLVADVVNRATQNETWSVQELLPLAYEELRVLAAYLLRGEPAARTLQPTALAHEAYLRLARETRSRLTGREHLMAVAASTMRRVLIDHARARRAQKRGSGATPVTLGETLLGGSDAPIELLDLHRALERLGEEHPRKVQVVELLYFAGLSHQEAGEVLGITDRTVLRDWRFAQAWLWRELSAGGAA